MIFDYEIFTHIIDYEIFTHISPILLLALFKDILHVQGHLGNNNIRNPEESQIYPGL